MNRFILILSVFFIGLSANSQDATKKVVGMDFFHGTWAEAKAEAKKQNKYIVVDAYASWCGPCKKMTRETFKDENVGNFYNKHFINYKIDMEKGEGPSLNSTFRVSAYPTVIYYNPQGEEVRRFKGYRPPQAFLGEGKQAVFSKDKLADYAKRFKKEKKNVDFLREYISYSSIGGSINKEATDMFLKKEKDNLFTDDRNVSLIYDAATDINAPFFKLIADNRAVFDEKYGKDDVNLYLRNSTGGTFLAAVEQKDIPTVEKSIAAMKLVDFAQKDLALLQMDLELNILKENYTAYAERVTQYFDAGNKIGDYNFLNSIAWTVYENLDDKKYLEKAEQWAKKSVQINSQYHNNDTLAALLLKQGKLEEGKAVALKAIDLAKRTRRDASGTKKLLEEYGF